MSTDDGNLDAFESWLTTCPKAEPPSRLRSECVATVPVPIVAGRQYQDTLSRSRFARLVGGTIALTAVLIFIIWIILSDDSSVFAQALAKSRDASLIHIVEKFQDPDRQPGDVRSSEWWIAPHRGTRRIARRNGTVLFEMVRDRTATSVWVPKKNEVRVEPNPQLDGVGEWIVDPTTDLLFFERKAKEQDIPIKVSELQASGKPVRRVRIENLTLDQSEHASLVTTIVVDIDAATNRVVRRWSHERALGKNRDNYMSLDATREFVIDYPVAGQFGPGFFELDYPDDAKVIHLGLPYYGSQSGPSPSGAVTKAKEEREMFIVAPISTPLQTLRNETDKQGYDRTTATAWVLINGDAFSAEPNSELDPRALSNCLRLLEGRLQTLHTEGRGSVRFKVLCRPSESGVIPDIAEHSRPVVEFGLEGVAKSCGYTNSLATVAIEDKPDWEEIVTSFAEGESEPPGKEDPIGDDLVRVFPVTTSISRFEYGAADCVVQVLPPLDKVTSQVSKRIEASMQRHVSELELSKKKRIAFLMAAPKPGSEFNPGDTIYARRIWKEALGFDEAVWITTMSPSPYIERPAAEPIDPYLAKANGPVGELAGLWKVVSSESKDGSGSYKPGYAMFSGSTGMVANEDWTTSFAFNYRVGESEGQSWIGLTLAHDIERRNEMPGIYSLQGDSMKLCYSTEVHGARPNDFSVAGSDKFVLLTLKRVSMSDSE